MLKYVVFFALLTFGPQPSKTPEGPDTAKSVDSQDGQKGYETKADKATAQPSNIAAVVPEKQAEQFKTETDQRERQITIEAQNRTFTGLLVIVGAFTGAFVGWQAWVTRSSVLATERHFKLVNQQWVDVSEWRCTVTPLVEDAIPTYLMSFRFVVSNSTPLPLTVTTVECFTDATDKGRTTIWNKNPLAPRGGRYKVTNLTVLMNAEQKAAYEGPGLAVAVVGRVNYVDAFDQPQWRLFGRFCRVQQGSEPRFPTYDLNLTKAWDHSEKMEREQKHAKSES